MEKCCRIIATLLIIICLPGAMVGQTIPGNYIFSSSITDSLATPVRMCIDDQDNIYVTDVFDKIIRKFNVAGVLSNSIQVPGTPVSVAVSHSGLVFYGDAQSGKIFRLNASGTATLFYANTAFPSAMVFDSEGLLYVSDSKLQRVLVIGPEGNLIRTFGENLLIYPTGITFDKKNNRILVAEHGGIGTGFNPVVRIRIFGLTGNLITTFGSNGNADGKFYRIQGIAVGRCGEIYVPEPYQGNVSVFSENTIFATRFGNYGDSTGQLRVPLDIAINSQDKIFITAENNGVIEVFNLDYLLPTASITSGNLAICSGNSAIIPVYLTGNAPWNFTYTVDGTSPVSINNIISSPYPLNISAGGVYKVTALNDSSKTGTCFSGSATVAVSSVVPEALVLTGNTDLCQGQTATLSVALNGTPPWNFTYTRNGINPEEVTNINSSPFLLTVHEPGIYEIVSVSGAGCTNAVSQGSAVVTERLLPSATLASGTVSICPGEIYQIPVSFTGTPPWSFTYTINNESPQVISNLTDNLSYITASVPGIYQVVQVHDAFCQSNLVVGIFSLIYKELPSASLAGGTIAFCSGDTSYLPVELTGNPPWSLSYTVNGINQTAISNIPENQFLLPATQSGIYRLEGITDASGCISPDYSGADTLTPLPLPVIPLPEKLSICPGDSVVLDPGPHVFYFWNDSTTTRTLTVFESGVYSVTVYDYTGCSTSASVTVEMKTAPASAIMSGNAMLCDGGCTVISVALSGLPPWTVSYTNNGQNPQTLNNINTSPFTFTTCIPGLYQISETADAQCHTAYSSGTASVTRPPALSYSFLSGNGFLCPGQTTDIVIGLAGTPPWNVTLARNGVNIVTLTGILTTPLIFPVSQSGTYEVSAISDSLCQVNGRQGNVTIMDNPAPAVNLGPDLMINEGSAVTLDASSSFAQYTWNDGTTASTLHVSFTGIYSVTVTGYNGCTGSDSVLITVSPVPVSSSVSSLNVTNNQCFNALQTIIVAGDGALFHVAEGGRATFIAGQNIQFLPGTLVDSGGYMLGYITSDNIFCGVMPANMVSVLHASQPDDHVNAITAADRSLKIYPNPSTGVIMIETDRLLTGGFRMDITDMSGKIVCSNKFEGDRLKEKMDIGHLPTGVYTVKLNSGTMVKLVKLVLID